LFRFVSTFLEVPLNFYAYFYAYLLKFFEHFLRLSSILFTIIKFNSRFTKMQSILSKEVVTLILRLKIFF